MSARAIRYQQHSDAEKAYALLRLVVNNDNIAKTAREVNIPRTTLCDWAEGRKINAHVTEMRHFGGVQLAEKLEEMTHQILDSMAEKTEEASLIELVKCAAIYVDIAVRLRGCTCRRAPR